MVAFLFLQSRVKLDLTQTCALAWATTQGTVVLTLPGRKILHNMSIE